MSNTASILPRDDIIVSHNYIRAACPTNFSVVQCDNFAYYKGGENISVGYPESALYPAPQLTYKETIGECDPLYADASGSFGSGGRPMYYSWSVYAYGTDDNRWVNTTAAKA